MCKTRIDEEKNIMPQSGTRLNGKVAVVTGADEKAAFEGEWTGENKEWQDRGRFHFGLNSTSPQFYFCGDGLVNILSEPVYQNAHIGTSREFEVDEQPTLPCGRESNPWG